MSESDQFIFGIHPVSEALSAKETKVERIYIREGLKSKAIQEIIEKASAKRVQAINVPGRKIHEMVGKVTDQGVVARMAETTYTEFEDWLVETDPKNNPFVIVLDEIEDVHNFGAILRSAAASGAAGVIVPKHRQAPVNAVVYKTSAGTAGRVPIIRVTNINQTLSQLKDEGFWIAALDGSGTQTIWDIDYNSPMAIIIGSEGHGVRQKTLESSDFVLNIPMENEVESLNASVSAALVMFEIQRRKFTK
jgi:23S rRNA (guanosine2251-2'-O)-methyltransferase